MDAESLVLSTLHALRTQARLRRLHGLPGRRRSRRSVPARRPRREPRRRRRAVAARRLPAGGPRRGRPHARGLLRRRGRAVRARDGRALPDRPRPRRRRPGARRVLGQPRRRPRVRLRHPRRTGHGDARRPGGGGPARGRPRQRRRHRPAAAAEPRPRARGGGGSRGHRPPQHRRGPPRRRRASLRAHAHAGRGHLRGGGRHAERPRQLRQRALRRGVGRGGPAVCGATRAAGEPSRPARSSSPPRSTTRSWSEKAGTRWRSGAIRRSCPCRSSSHGHVLGVVELSDYQPRDFAEDLDLIRGLGQVAAHALENASLFEQVDRRNRILNELVELGSLASRTRDLDELVRTVAERILGAVDAANCDIYRVVDGVLRCVASFDRSGHDDSVLGTAFDLERYPTTVEAMYNHQVLAISSPEDPQLSEAERTTLPRLRLLERGLPAARRQRRALRPARHLRHSRAGLLRVSELPAQQRADDRRSLRERSPRRAAGAADDRPPRHRRAGGGRLAGARPRDGPHGAGPATPGHDRRRGLRHLHAPGRQAPLPRQRRPRWAGRQRRGPRARHRPVPGDRPRRAHRAAHGHLEPRRPAPHGRGAGGHGRVRVRERALHPPHRRRPGHRSHRRVRHAAPRLRRVPRLPAQRRADGRRSHRERPAARQARAPQRGARRARRAGQGGLERRRPPASSCARSVPGSSSSWRRTAARSSSSATTRCTAC